MPEFEPIGGGLSVAVDDTVRVLEDALLLARFAAPAPDDAACDLGTGNGIIPLLWCRRTPPHTLVAVEREAACCRLCRLSLEHHQLTDTVRLIEADWNDEAAMPAPSSMTLVTCNPPYFPFGASRPSPDPVRDAMRREDRPDALFALCRAAARLLAANGRFCMVHRPERLGDIFAALAAASLTITRLQCVQSQEGVKPHLVLIEAKHRGSLSVLPPLITSPRGDATDVYRRLYR